MSLLNDLAVRCVRLDAEYAEGEGFDAVLIPRGGSVQIEARRAVDAATFDVVVDEGVVLRFHELFRRVSDGRVFRMTGDTADWVAPGMASVRIARATCERWDIL